MALPKMPRAVASATSDVGEGRFPKPLVAAVVCWTFLGIIMLLSRLGAPTPTDADATETQLGQPQIQSPTFDSYWWAPYLWVLGIVILGFTVVLYTGRAWARIALALVGMLSLIGLAMVASWLAIPAAVLLLVGSVCGLVVSSHRYLTGYGETVT